MNNCKIISMMGSHLLDSWRARDVTWMINLLSDRLDLKITNMPDGSRHFEQLNDELKLHWILIPDTK